MVKGKKADICKKRSDIQICLVRILLCLSRLQTSSHSLLMKSYNTDDKVKEKPGSQLGVPNL